MTEVSPVYETAPVDAPEGSKDFLNAVVLVDTTLSARTLLDRALAIEDAFGRERTGERDAPRTLDVDLIVVGDRRADDEDLVLPHPRAHERAFVLAPWHDVEPDAELPGVGPVAELLEKVRPRGRHPARRPDAQPAVSTAGRARAGPGATTTTARLRRAHPDDGPGLARRASALTGLVLGWLVRPVAIELDGTAPPWAGFPSWRCSSSPLIVGSVAWSTHRSLPPAARAAASRTRR